MLERTNTDTGVDVPPGPLPPDFRASIDRALKDLIPSGKNGAVLAVVTTDERGRPAAVVGMATKVFENDKTEWRIGVELQKAWSGPASGRVLVWGTW